MTAQQTQIQIPERRDDEPPATAQQLQLIRQLATGRSLQGYRFDYRKLGHDQAATILQQLQAMNDQPTPSAPRKQGPGCVTSLVKGTTALIVWAIVLAGVAGGAYLIYNHIQNNPKPTTSTDDGNIDTSDAPAPPPNRPDTHGSSTGSTIFEGLGASDSPSSPTDRTTPGSTDPADTSGSDPLNPATTPDAATRPTELRELDKQLAKLEELLVTLSQGTRQTFDLDVRTQSSEAMQRALGKLPQALSALDADDPTLSLRIQAAIDAFAADQVDGPALRDDIKAIRDAIDKLQ